MLFADVADSTRLFRDHGDEGARALLRRALELGGEAVEAAGGRVVETIGDELFCLLPDGAAALNAAIGLHEAVLEARLRRELPPALAFRVGFAYGPVGFDDGHPFGDTVYLAKRVSTSAKAEQLLCTRGTLAALELPPAARARTVDLIRLKGRVDEVELVEIVWRADATVDRLDAPPARRAPTPRRLRLQHGEHGAIVDATRPSASIGRAATSDVCVDDGRVSRLHARVELRRDGFALVDMSRNGCEIRANGAPPCTVVRGEAALGEAGEIRLGPDADAPVLRYATLDDEPA